MNQSVCLLFSCGDIFIFENNGYTVINAFLFSFAFFKNYFLALVIYYHPKKVKV